MSILLLGFAEDDFTPKQREAIAAAAGDLTVRYSRDRSEIESLLPEVEVAVENRKFITDMPNLKWMQQWGAGADWLMDNSEAAERDFVLTNVSGVHAIPIGEQIMAYLLAFARGFPLAVRHQTERHWSRDVWLPNASGSFELSGKTMLLLGTGAIGVYTAKLARAFDIRVVGVRRDPAKAADYIDEMIALDDLQNHLPNADFVILTLPLTHDTHHLMGETELRAMKSTAILVNIGRGGLIDEQALAKALQEGWIAGAGLDVFETEPLPESSPLWALDNALVTPHTAGDTPHYNERALTIFLENLRRYQAGEPLSHVVDKQLGY